MIRQDLDNMLPGWHVKFANCPQNGYDRLTFRQYIQHSKSPDSQNNQFSLVFTTVARSFPDEMPIVCLKWTYQ